MDFIVSIWVFVRRVTFSGAQSESNWLVRYAVIVTISSLILWVAIVEMGPGTYRFWLWTPESWIAIGTGALPFGFIGAYIQIEEGRRRRRVELSPYIRVDIGSNNRAHATHFNKPTSYFTRKETCVDLAPDRAGYEKVNVSAWFRNYQVHALGFAVTIRARFLIQIYDPVEEIHTISILPPVEIAYLENGYTVEAELIRAPENWSFSVEVIEVAYRDIYDREHQYSVGLGNNSNVIHGRLLFFHNPEEGNVSLPVSYHKDSSDFEGNVDHVLLTNVDGQG